jgi:hypothetical protein
MVTCDGAGASHELVKELNRLASRHGYQVTWSVGWTLSGREQAAIGKVPESAWEAAIDAKGQVREHRADEACENPRCAHSACWIEEAHVAELTGLLREGPAGDCLKGWPKAMRVFARRERRTRARSCRSSRRPTGGATRSGRRTCPLTRGAGEASAPTPTPPTGSTPGSRT